MTKAIFIGINQDRVIEAAVSADSLAAAKQLLPGLDVIKMTSKTKLFITSPKLPSREKLMLSGATKRPKGGILPTATVYDINGRIEFATPVYRDNEPVRNMFYVSFADTPGQPSVYRICE